MGVANSNNVGGCSDSLSWTDANGNAQSLTVPGGADISVSSSLPPNGAVTWTSSGSSANTSLAWQLERAPAQSISGGINNTSVLCGSSGTVYTNLTSATVNLDLGASSGYDSGCAFALTWTDANDQSHTLGLGNKGSSGVSTSLPAGGVISWRATGTKGYVDLGWQIERVDTSELW